PVTILPYCHESARLCEWDSDAPQVAQRLAEFLMARMPGFSVEHIGSTAVAGCGGKGVLDLMVVYPAGRLSEARDLLDAAGFQRQSSRDPFPEERPMRIGAIEHNRKTFRVHAHVIAEDSPEIAVLRGFRDRLRADDGMRAAYVEKKRAILAEGTTDPVDYSAAKDEFIQRGLA